MFTESSPTLEALLEGKEQFTIPKYQRGYSWRMMQATEMFEDLQAYAGLGNEDALFLGTCIMKTDKARTDVVDGQQRLTTLILLLIACRTRAREIEHSGTAHEITSRISTTDRRGRSLGPKLLASPSIVDVFTEMCSDGWDGSFSDKIGRKPVRRQRKLLEPQYNFFLQELRKLPEQRFFEFLDAVYEARFIRIDVSETINALSIFERTNARGVELEVSDLLKNFLFQSSSDAVEEKWEQVSSLADGQLQRMLKYAFVSQQGAVRKKDLYTKLKAVVRDSGPDAFLDRLIRFGTFFQMMRSGGPREVCEFFELVGCEKMAEDQNNFESFHLSVSALRDFQILQPIPLVYAAIECMLRLNRDQYKPLLRLVSALERYHFVNNLICTRIGNEVEKLYADSCAEFASSTDFNASVDKLIVKLRKQRAGRDEFVDQFADLEYSSANLPWIAYVFDRMQNHGARPGSRIIVYDSDNKALRRRKFDIEHFAPRNPATPHDAELSKAIDNIGNLLVISEQTNKLMQNKPPRDKAKILASAADAKKFRVVEQFLVDLQSDDYEWTAGSITTRATKLAAEAYDTVFAF